MAAKETMRTRAARVREEMRETGHLVLHAPALVRTAECVMRFLLSALLSGAELFGGYAPFAVGLTAVSGAGPDGFAALLGALFGYLSFLGFREGLRYASASILVYAVSFAFWDLKVYERTWFVPVSAGAMTALTGLVYFTGEGWSEERVIFFLSEVLLSGASAYFYRIAFSPWADGREEESLTVRQVISLLLLGGTVLLTLSRITVLGGLSLGRSAAALAVMVAAYEGGMGAGAALGIAAGVGMDLAGEKMAFYSMAYALSGVMAGAFHRQGRLCTALAYVLANAAAVLWTWQAGGRLSLLWEVLGAAVCFLLLPRRTLRAVRALLVREGRRETEDRARAHACTRLTRTAGAFRELGASLRAHFAQPGPNDNDASGIFDRAANRVCRTCPQRQTCWQRDYVTTYNALNDALPRMLDRGRGESRDFPDHFTSRCQHFGDFLSAANEELSALLYRRQYRSRLRENREEVCRQYAELSSALQSAAEELSLPLAPDPARERRLRQYFISLGTEAEPMVYHDASGRLRLEVEGTGLGGLCRESVVRHMSSVLSVPLRLVERRRDHLVFAQREPFQAAAGVAARRKDGETVSGDSGAWFKREDGRLFVLLCDGMGSGPGAQRESSEAVRLLEAFLRAGLPAQEALRTLSGALSLQGEETGGFTTIDLLEVDLFTGNGAVYKYGAAPTYIRQGSAVSRLTGSTLPAGLAPCPGPAPDVSRFQLRGGDWVLMVSDGVAGVDEDIWLRERLRTCGGASPRDLARALLEEGSRRVGGGDDRTVILLRLDRLD